VTVGRLAVLRSVRLRLTVAYSVAVFGVAGLVIGGIYMSLARELKPVSKEQPVVDRVLSQEGLPFKKVVVWSPTVDVLGAIRNQERHDTLHRLRRLTFEALGALFAFSLLIGWLVAGRVLRPVEQITATARRIQAKSLSERIALDGPQDELKTLADTFDQMLDRIEDSFTAQRQFVADASHELRNPLAVIRTNTDVALWDDDLPESARSRLLAVQRACDRMRRLVDDLLALARLELAAAQRTEIDLDAVVHEVRDELDPLARAHGLELLEEPRGSGILVQADRDSIKRALSNLLDNAFRHSPRGTPVRVGAIRQNGWAVLAVSDAGPGLTEEEQEHVFERFWRSDSSRSRESGGIGLGLAIVRRIAESHGGEVSVSSSPGAGSRFEIRLPV
jgi:heavy metal sensor kinase